MTEVRRSPSDGLRLAEELASSGLPRVLTPSMLAEWWQCSENHVRNLIATGELKAWRLGGKMFRITRESVLEFEARRTQELQEEIFKPDAPSKAEGFERAARAARKSR